MAWDQEVDINFGEESQEDERDEHREADERSGRWGLDQSMKMMKTALLAVRMVDVWRWRSRGRESTRAVPKCGSSSAGTSMRGGGGGILVFLQQQCDKSSRVNSTRDNHDGCAILWRRCKVIDSAHTRNAHAHTNTPQVFEQLKKPVDPKVIEQRERELNERAQSQYDRAQRRQAEIVRLNTEYIIRRTASNTPRSASTPPSQ